MGCLWIGTVDARIVLELASYGYYVIVDGAVNATFTGGPGGGPKFAGSTDGFEAIDWVVEQSESGKLKDVDHNKFVVAGTSCGGILSYNTIQDKRVIAAAIISSGLFGGPIRAKLNELKKPIGFFEGGVFDGGSRNGKADYDILKSPVVWANGPFGHGGGGPYMAAAVATFMDWQTRGNATARKAFLDPSDTFIKSLGYQEVDRKNWT